MSSPIQKDILSPVRIEEGATADIGINAVLAEHPVSEDLLNDNTGKHSLTGSINAPYAGNQDGGIIPLTQAFLGDTHLGPVPSGFVRGNYKLITANLQARPDRAGSAPGTRGRSPTKRTKRNIDTENFDRNQIAGVDKGLETQVAVLMGQISSMATIITQLVNTSNRHHREQCRHMDTVDKNRKNAPQTTNIKPPAPGRSTQGQNKTIKQKPDTNNKKNNNSNTTTQAKGNRGKGKETDTQDHQQIPQHHWRWTKGTQSTRGERNWDQYHYRKEP